MQLPAGAGAPPRQGPLSVLWELVFPSRCTGCDRRGMLLCADCMARVPWLPAESCPRCAEPSRGGAICRRCHGVRPRALISRRAACAYEGSVRNAIRRLKFRGERTLAPLLAQLIEVSLATRPLTADLTVPVPLSAGRLLKRGYNQSELIARELARLGTTTAPVSAALRRARETRPQTELPRAERLANVRGAFVCPAPELVDGRTVLLIDDVSTTGSTLEACAEALLAAGASQVRGLVVARSSHQAT